MHHYQFNISDWLSHTSHLTPTESGVYLRLLNHYYDTEKPIPVDLKFTLRRLTLTRSGKIVDSILEEFFYMDGNEWRNKRADKEIAKFYAKSDKARDSAKARWDKEHKNNDADAMRTHAPSIANGVRTPCEPDATHDPVHSTHDPVPKTQDTSSSKQGPDKSDLPSKRFIPPTLQEVTDYCKERNNTVNPQSFVDHYETNGWMRGKNKIKNWKSCVHTWEGNQRQNGKGQPESLDQFVDRATAAGERLKQNMERRNHEQQ
jgi:uncharacterized protein YdaU (DUF1376 family)